MGEFGWAYISGSTGLRNAEGVSGSVQFKDTSGGINGSDKFRYKNEHHVLELTGNLRILGDITASNYVIENVSNLEAAGSSKFGNSSDDLHQFTGSIYADGTRHLYTGSVHIKGATDVAGPMTASTTITATKFIGDGSELTNLPAATGISHANSGQYRLVSSVTSTSIQGESNLIWESNNLKITGSAWVSSILSGSDLRGDGQNIDNISATKLSHGTLDNARLPSDISVTSVAGDGSGLTALNASNISAGTINNTYLPTIDNSKLPSIINVSRVSGSMGLSGSTVFGKTAKFSQDVTVQGTLTANNLNITTTGDTIFGDHDADEHQFTGSVFFKGPLTASTGISASVLIGDGAQITGLPPYGSPAIGYFNDGAQYRLVTAVNADTVQGEANLTWKSNNLFITGSVYGSSVLKVSRITGSVGVSGSLVLGNSAKFSQNITTLGNLGVGTEDPDTLLHLYSTAASKPVLKIENQQGGSNPVSIQMVRNTSTPAADDAIGQIDFRSKNSADAEKLYAYITGKSTDVTSTDEDGEIQLYTMQGGSLVPVMTLQSGKVGVGTQDPEGKLHIYSGEASIAPSALADELVVEGAESTGISILTPNNQVGRLYFGDSDNSARAYIIYDHSIDMMKFSVASANRLVINSAGNVGIGLSYPENPDHTLTVAGDISASVNVSASAFYGDGSNLLNVGGTLTVKEEGSSLTTEATSINFIGAYVTASNSGTDVTVTVNAGAGGTSVIGPAEDASYADGLFSDFTTTTTVGTAVDKFNEVLKILAPTPAPGVQHIGVEGSVPTGITAKLSYGSSNAIGGVTSHGTTVFSPAIGRNGVYTTDTDGYKRKLGVFDGQDITGIINYDIAASVTNGNYAYKNDSFGNGETGTLKLELNGNPIHTINLASVAGAGAPPNGTDDSNVNGNGSGFIDVSATANTLDGNGADWGSIFKYRSAKYKIAASDQVSGWNYLRVIHTVGSTDYASNYVEWINDPGSIDSYPLTLDRNRVEDVSLIGSRYLSGVKYNTDATANYKVDILNMYKNVFPNGGTPISFTPTNAAAISAIAVNDLAGVETNTKIIQLTKSLDCNVNNLLDGQLGCNISVTHPLKNNLSNQGAASAGGFLIENRTQTHDWNTENFHDESFRITSASYDDQNSVRVAASTWNSQTHMLSAGGYDDGLLLYNQALRSPKQGVNSGDFRNSGDGGSLTNGPAGNPNYSGISGDRTYFRVLTNSSGVTARDLRIQTTKASTTFNNSALTTNNAHLFVKIPGTTGWMDATKDFYYGNILDFDGALNPSASNDVDSGNNTHYLTFGTASVANGDHIVLKIVAKDTWTGNISTMEFTPNVSTATDAAALTTIDSNTDGLLNAKLSFGASNDIATYSKATGSAIGGSNFNINDNYTRAGTRSGVFSSKPTFIGDVNSGNQFKFAYEGSLILKVNDTEIHSVDLHNLAAIPAAGGQYDANGNGSGFDLSRVDFRSGPAGALDYRYPYRTGTFKVVPADQNLGWNWAQVIHRRDGETDITTSYVEWVNDTDGSTMDSGSAGLENFEHDHIYYQSGVKYFASRPSASFAFTVSNAYKNVYYHDSDGINFPTVTRCSINKIRIAGDGINVTESADGVNQLALGSLKAVANSHAEIFQVTGTVLYANNESIVGDSNIFTSYDDLAVKGQVKHPIKADLETKTYGTTAFMFHSGTLNSSTLYTNEYFGFERYRLQDTTYANQAAITNSSNKWNSQTSVNDQAGNATHATGLVTVNGKCVSPFKIGISGDTRNVADKGASGLQAPSGNPNYSTLTNATRTYYRYFENNSGVLKQNGLTITLQGDAKLVSKDSGDGRYEALGANKNITVELKVPTDPSYTGGSDLSTGWMDCVKAWDDTEDGTVDGAGLAHGSVTQTFTGNGSSTINLEFQTLGIYNGQKFVVRIRAHKDWTGYLSSVRMAY